MRCTCVSGRVCVSTRVCSVYMSYVSMCSCVCTCVLHVCGALRTCVHTPCARVCARVPCVREHLCVRCPRRPPGTVPQPQSRVGGVGAVSASGSVLGCRWARSSWSGNSLESPGTHRVTHLGPPHSAAAASGFPGARPVRAAIPGAPKPKPDPALRTEHRSAGASRPIGTGRGPGPHCAPPSASACPAPAALPSPGPPAIFASRSSTGTTCNVTRAWREAPAPARARLSPSRRQPFPRWEPWDRRA